MKITSNEAIVLMFRRFLRGFSARRPAPGRQRRQRNIFARWGLDYVLACGVSGVLVVRPVCAQTPQATAAPTATLIGTVTDTSGAPLSRAEIWLVAVRTLRTAYKPATFTAPLKPGKTHRARFPLTPSAQTLAEVNVQDTASSWLSLFDARRAEHRGTFITRKDFEKENLRIATDILRR